MNTENTPYLSCRPDFKKIIMDQEVKDSPMAARIMSRLPGVPAVVLSRDQKPDQIMDSEQETVLYLKHYRGRFLRPCPGTSQYRCCGYQIIHIGENCPLNCSYCILQAYFQDRIIKVWANQNQLWEELDKAFSADRKRLFRVGTGEFTDSLALESLTGYSRDLAGFLAHYPNVCLELKSKTIDLSWMDKVRNNQRILPAWSVNSPEIILEEEKGASSLEERLQAARYCAELGFRVCLHFDPIIHYPGWEKGYSLAAEMILDHLKPENIAYISLGSFRFMPWLKDIISRNHPDSAYIYNEFITGLDGKTRLVLPLRLQQFKHIAHLLTRGGLGPQLYFCMESDLVWKEVLKDAPAGNRGLARRLLNRSFLLE